MNKKPVLLTEEARAFLQKVKEGPNDYLELNDFEKSWRPPLVPTDEVRQNILDALNNGELTAPC